MAAKLVVTKVRNGTKITLVGTSGTELLASKVFTEPRGKGATLRALKGLLGEDIVIDDQTTPAASTSTPAAAPVPAKRAAATRGRSSAKAVAATSGRGATARAATRSRGAVAAKPAARKARKPAK